MPWLAPVTTQFFIAPLLLPVLGSCCLQAPERGRRARAERRPALGLQPLALDCSATAGACTLDVLGARGVAEARAGRGGNPTLAVPTLTHPGPALQTCGGDQRAGMHQCGAMGFWLL